MSDEGGGSGPAVRFSRSRKAQALGIAALCVWWLIRGGPHGGLQHCAEDFGHLLSAIIRGGRALAGKVHHR